MPIGVGPAGGGITAGGLPLLWVAATAPPAAPAPRMAKIAISFPWPFVSPILAPGGATENWVILVLAPSPWRTTIRNSVGRVCACRGEKARHRIRIEFTTNERDCTPYSK